MKTVELVSLLDKLCGFIESQEEFVAEAERHDPQRRSVISVIYLDLYLAILIEFLVLGVTFMAFWSIYEFTRRMNAKITRPKYYPQENERRRRLAAERRKIRIRSTVNRAPTADELREQYAKVRRNPKEMIRFGSMLCDLEAYVDNSLILDESGEIAGRQPGIKGWLKENCPEMAAHYKTVIRYKALAEKFRQAVGLSDPHPAAEALGDAPKTRKNAQNPGEKNEVDTTERNPCKSAICEECEMIIQEAGISGAGLMAALDRRLNPDMILGAGKWQSRYGRKVLTA